LNLFVRHYISYLYQLALQADKGVCKKFKSKDVGISPIPSI